MSSSMRNFVEAYAAVHNTEAKEELTSSRDCISEMNLSDLTDTDLDEIVEQVLELMFSQGHTVDSAHEVFGEAFEESNITGRQQKIERLCEALNRAFDNIDSKASTVALEEFAKYRNNKKLQESWSARFNQEKRIQRAHDRLVAAESLNVKTQLLKLVEGTMDIKGFEIPKKEQKAAADRVKEKTAQKMMKKEEVSQIRKGWGDAYRSIYEKKLDPVGKEDGDVDNDGDKDSSDEYLMKRRKAIGKAMGKDMKKEEVEQVDEGIADRARKAVGHQRQGTHGDDHEMDKDMKSAQKSVKRMNDRMGADAAGKRSEMDVKRRFPKNEGVEFSEAELKAFEEIVNSWED